MHTFVLFPSDSVEKLVGGKFRYGYKELSCFSSSEVVGAETKEDGGKRKDSSEDGGSKVNDVSAKKDFCTDENKNVKFCDGERSTMDCLKSKDTR